MAQDGLASFEPAFVDELAVILAWALAYIQKDGERRTSERRTTWLRDETGGSVYLRLSTRPVEQISAHDDAGARARRSSTAPTGCASPARTAKSSSPIPARSRPKRSHAVGLMAEDRRDVGLLAVTSADRLNAGWTAAQRARERGLAHARSPFERLFADVPPHCGIVTVIDGHPATLAWLGGVSGHRVRRSASSISARPARIADLYRHYGIDANAIVAAAQAIAPGRPIRHLRGWGSARSGALSPAAYCSGAQPIGPDGPAVLGRPPPNRLIPPPRLERRKRSRWRIPIAFRSERSMCWLGLRAFTAA